MDIQVRNNSQIVVKLFPSNLPKRRGKGTYSKLTIDLMNSKLQKNFFPYFDLMRVDYKNEKQVLETGKEYLSDLLEKGETESNTIRNEKSILASWLVFNYSMNPKRVELELSEIKIPEMKTDKTEKAKEYDFLSSSLEGLKNKKHKLIIQFAYYSASRVSELLSIRLKDKSVSRDNKEIHFTVIGKGNKERVLRCSVEMYESILKEFNSESKDNKNKFLFWNPKSKSGKFSRQFIYLLTKQVGNYTPHQLRHSRATDLVENGTPINEVSELLGHASVNTTQKFYLHNKIKSETLQRKVL